MGSCTNWCSEKQLSLDDYRDWGHMPIQHEALGSGVACYRLSSTYKLATYCPRMFFVVN